MLWLLVSSLHLFILPPVPARTERGITTDRLDLSLGTAACSRAPQPGRPPPPRAPKSSFPAKLGYNFTATPAAPPQHRLQLQP